MKLKTTLSFKLIGIVVVLSLIIFSTLAYTIIRQKREILEQSYFHKAEIIANALDTSIRSREDLGNKSQLLTTINKYLWLNPDIVEISLNLPSQNNLVTIISNNPHQIGKIADNQNLISYRKDVLKRRIIRSRTLPVLRVTAPVHISGQVVGTYQIDFTLETIHQSITLEIRRTLIYFIAMFFVFIVTLSYFVRLIVLKPISEITHGIEEVRRKNLDYKIKVKTRDELGKLASAFNHMTEDLKKSRSELEKYSKTLEKQVASRTRELNTKVKELTDARTAMLNMMEDLLEAKKEVEKKVEERTQELKKAYEELKELDRMKDEFLAITSHELKTPLTSIILLTEMLMEDLKDKLNEEEKEDLRTIYQESLRLRDLILDVLELSKLESGRRIFNLRPLNVKSIVEQTFANIRGLAEARKIALKYHLPHNLPKVIGDEEALIKVLNNLLNNAIKFSPEGSSVEVEAERKKNVVEFRVIDHGIGIPKSEHKKIFDRFYQVERVKSRKYGGTGLGLSICKKIINAHKGKIWVKSKPGEGSIFYFTLPIAK